MKLSVGFYVLSLLVLSVYADIGMSFLWKYGGVTNNEVGYSVKKTNEGGYIIAGSSSSYGTSTNIMLVKFSFNGTVEFIKSYDSGNIDVAKSISVTNDSGFVVCGESDNNIFVSKFDSSGNVEWAKTLFGDCYGYSVDTMSDGSIIIGGLTFDTGNNDGDNVLAKFFANGTLDWMMTVGTILEEQLGGVSVGKDDDIYISGYTDIDGSQEYDSFLFKLTSDGNIDWGKIYGSVGHDDEGLSVVSLSSGAAVVGKAYYSDASSNNVFVSKYEQDGSLSWVVSFELDSNSDVIYSVNEISNGNLVIAGTASTTKNAFAASFDSTGEFVWFSYVDKSDIDEARSIEELNNGSLVITGYQTIGGKKVAFVSTLTSEGDGCDWKKLSKETINYARRSTPTPANWPIKQNRTVLYSVFSIKNLTLTEKNLLLNQSSYQCSVLNCNGKIDLGCSSNGVCMKNYTTSNNYCNCTDPDYFGEDCSDRKFYCHGIYRFDSGVCNAHGNCVSDDQCDCIKGYFGSMCNLTQSVSFWSYFGGHRSQGKCIQETEDGGFIIVGETQEYSEYADIFVIKISAYGTLEFSVYFGGDNQDVALSVEITRDGALVIAGITSSSFSSGNADLFITKLNSTGGMEWMTVFGGVSSEAVGRKYENIYLGERCVVEDPRDDSFVMVGKSNSFASTYMIFVVKFNSSGGLQWASIYGSEDNGAKDEGYSIFNSPMGGYIVSGSTNNCGDSSYGNMDIVILKIDEDGSLDWSKNIGGSENEFPFSTSITSDNGTIVVGNTKSWALDGDVTNDIILTKFDKNGLLEWCSVTSRTVKGKSSEGYSVLELEDGSFIITLRSEGIGRDGEAMMVSKFSSVGILLATTQLVMGVGEDSFQSISSSKTSDGGLIFTGGKVYKPSGIFIPLKAYVAKMYDYDTSCNAKDVSQYFTQRYIMGMISLTCSTIKFINITDQIIVNQLGSSVQVKSNSSFEFEIQCRDNFECYGVLNDSYACSGHGNCSSNDNCECDTNYVGDECEFHSCFGFFNNDTENACSKHGECVAHNHCECAVNYTSSYDCSMWKCYGFWKNNSKVCSGDGNIKRGNCTKHDYCDCNTNYQVSLNCDWECYGVENWEIDSCGVYGDCIDHNTCNCTSNNYTLGSQICDTPVCRGIAKGTEGVCSGHGTCVNPNECECLLGYQSLVDGYCDWFGCFGITFSDTSKVCNGHGTCFGFNECSCRDDYEGSSCSTWKCGGYDKDSLSTCSGNGDCISPGTCKCTKTGFVGDNCQENTLYMTVMLPVLSSSGVSALGIFVLLIFACCCCSIFICCCSIFVICCLGVYIISKAFKYKKFDKLKNLDILLQEQYAEENTDIAQIKINKKLFEIPIKEIKIIRILGEGGSSSTVYLAKWQGQKVAFKCFRTRMICSSQDSFDEFDQEVQVFANLGHPNIVSFFGATLDPPRVGIVMEFCPKGECYEYVVEYEEKTGKKYPMKERIRMLSEISSAMEYLHSRGIVHRDLKTENVLLNDAEQCKLMDFGVARISERLSKQITKGIGTSFYMAPEVTAGGGMYNEKCDIFSFGIFVFIMISGNNMPYGSDMMGIELKVASNPNYRPKIKYMEEVLTEEQNWVIDLAKDCWIHEANERPSFKEICERIIEKLSDFKEMEVIVQEDKNSNKNDMNEVSSTSVQEEELDYSLLIENLKEDLGEKEKIIEKMSKEIEILKKK